MAVNPAVDEKFTIEPPANVDVGMIAPKGPGHLLRSVYRAGGGVPDAAVAATALRALVRV